MQDKIEKSIKQRKRLIYLFSLISIIFSIAFLYNRNFYGDEFTTFEVFNWSVPEIWNRINNTDVHPPGMYVLAKFFFELFGSERWMTLGPLLVFYSGLISFALKTSASFSVNPRVFTVFLLIFFLHPQTLLWINSIRWYPYWVGIALVALTLSIKVDLINEDPRSSTLPSASLCIATGLATGLLFYIQYITIVFMAAFFVAFLFRYPLNLKTFRCMSFILCSFSLLILPQIGPFFNEHLLQSGSQIYTMTSSFSRLSFGTFIGDALLPWHPASIIFFLVVVAPALVASLVHAFAFFKQKKLQCITQSTPCQISFLIFFTAMFILGIASGLGIKSRSFLILAPLSAIPVTYGISIINNKRFEYVCIMAAIFWICSGYSNLLFKKGTIKAEFILKPQEVVDLIKNNADQKCSIIFSTSALATYHINKTKGQQPWSVCSVCNDFIHDVPKATIEHDCEPEMVFLIKARIKPLRSRLVLWRMHDAWNTVSNSILNPKTACLSFDKNSKRKTLITKKFFPECRYKVIYGKAKEGVNWEEIASKYDFRRSALADIGPKTTYHP